MPHKLGFSDKWFLDLKRRDALTRENFKIGDEVVVCESCRTVSLKASWTYCIENNLGGCCACGGNREHHGFERRFIDYAHTHPTLKIRSRSAARSASQKSLRSIASQANADRLFTAAACIMFSFLVVLAVYIFSFDGLPHLEIFQRMLLDKRVIFLREINKLRQLPLTDLLNELFKSIFRWISGMFG